MKIAKLPTNLPALARKQRAELNAEKPRMAVKPPNVLQDVVSGTKELGRQTNYALQRLREATGAVKKHLSR